MVDKNGQMAPDTKEIGKMIKQMGLEPTLASTLEAATLVTGKMISNMGSALRHGLTATNMKEITNLETKKVKVSTYGKMEVGTQEIG